MKRVRRAEKTKEGAFANAVILKPAPFGAGFITERGKDGRETTAAGGEGKL